MGTKVLIGAEKGGSGKSTCALNMAVWLANEGADVLLLDADPQATGSKFIERRDELRIKRPELPRVHIAQKHGDVFAAVQDYAQRYEVVIIDAGGRDSRELRTAMAAADLFLTPIKASQADLETLPHINNMVQGARDLNRKLLAYAFLSMAPSNPLTREVESARELIAEFDQLELASSIIRDRKVYRDALADGLGVVEMTNSQAKAEIQLLGQEFFFD